MTIGHPRDNTGTSHPVLPEVPHWHSSHRPSSSDLCFQASLSLLFLSLSAVYLGNLSPFHDHISTFHKEAVTFHKSFSLPSLTLSSQSQTARIEYLQCSQFWPALLGFPGIDTLNSAIEHPLVNIALGERESLPFSAIRVSAQLHAFKPDQLPQTLWSTP